MYTDVHFLSVVKVLFHRHSLAFIFRHAMFTAGETRTRIFEFHTVYRTYRRFVRDAFLVGNVYVLRAALRGKAAADSDCCTL